MPRGRPGAHLWSGSCSYPGPQARLSEASDQVEVFAHGGVTVHVVAEQLGHLAQEGQAGVVRRAVAGDSLEQDPASFRCGISPSASV
jgi:hypothetical protein